MRLIRGLAGAVLWILAALLGLISVVLCVTVILLPLGIPLLGLSRRLFSQAIRLMLPQSVAHPAKGMKKSFGRRRDKAAAALPDAAHEVKKPGRKLRRSR